MKIQVNQPLVAVWASSALLWAVLFVAVPPARQDFPLNDDWAYAKGLFTFAHGEGIHYYGWASMPLLGQWLLALPFVKLLGESHVALRLMTIFLSWLGVLAFFDLLRQAGLTTGKAGFLAAALALNPLFFVMSGVYMTDLPALALSLMALAWYARGIRYSHPWFMLAACLVACLGAITRQNSLAAPVSAGLFLLTVPSLRRRFSWLLAVLLPVMIGLATDAWFATHPEAFRVLPRVPTPGRLLLISFTSLHTLGLWLLPLFLLTPKVRLNRSFWVAWMGLLICAGFYYGKHRSLAPYLGNLITPWGQFEPGQVVVGDRPALLGFGSRLVLTVGGCFAGAMVLLRLLDAFYKEGWREPLFLFTLVHALLLLTASNLFDRYVLVLLPGALYGGLISAPPVRFRWSAGLLGLAFYGFVALGWMHDWLAWNSARWELGKRALQRGIPAHEIEGGFEWDGWHSPYPARHGTPAPPRGFVLELHRTLFPHLTGRYALSFSELPGTKVIDSEPYSLWLPPVKRRFYLLMQE